MSGSTNQRSGEGRRSGRPDQAQRPRVDDLSTVSSAAEAFLAQLPPPLREIATAAGDIAAERGERAYMVGGVVRDLALGRASHDLDIVVVGDGLALAQALSRSRGGTLTRFHTFGSARVELPELVDLEWAGPHSEPRGPHCPEGLRRGLSIPEPHVDIATARREVYARPGQLPQVEAGSLEEDLERRDFTINAIALELAGAGASESRLVDPLGGIDDLRRGLVRIMHSRSFADDPTRLLRALRFALRFGYKIEEQTAAAIEEAAHGDYLATLSGQRLRRELLKLLTEAPVDGALALQDHKLLGALHPSLTADRALLENLAAAAEATGINVRERGPLVLAALAAGLEQQERWRLARHLRFERRERRALVDGGARLRRAVEAWLTARSSNDGPLLNSCLEKIFGQVKGATLLLAPALVGRLQRPIGPTAKTDPAAQMTRPTSTTTQEEMRIDVQRYLTELRELRLDIGGDDLLEMGCSPGPAVGRVLERLRFSMLDGEATSAAEQRRLARQLIDEKR